MDNSFLKVILLLILVITIQIGRGQGVTTSSMTGVITNVNGEGLPSATVLAIHTPSGTRYGTTTLVSGNFTIPNMRVGGPYTITISHISSGNQVIDNVNLSLGTATTLNVKLLEESNTLGEVVVTTRRNNVFSSARTGAATNISRDIVNALPTLNRSINDFTRLTPQANGTGFGGQDNRMNNITVDGSVMNSSFGLGSEPGARTGSTAISLDAIEQIQVNVAPYDVTQSGFTGAGVNAVTRSGTNEFSGSVFSNIQNDNLVGRKARGTNVTVANFENKQAGFRLGGPIIKDKLFFFINGELERRKEPAHPYLANAGGETVAGNKTRVEIADLDQFSNFLRTNFGYETGPYQGYNIEKRSNKILAKLDYNINQNHKASIRYNMLDSRIDRLVGNGGVSGNRRDNLNSMTFQNSNYGQLESIRSVIGEVNSTFGSKFSNNLIIGYTDQDEGRDYNTEPFPLIDIQKNDVTYMSAGFDPSTYLNKVRYKTFQLQDNITHYAGKHTITAGINIERMKFFNTFVQNGVGVYTYSSLQDFYTAANAFLANPHATASPVTLRRFQQQYSALPGGAEPVNITQVFYSGVYLQDRWKPFANLTLTAGIRADVPYFSKTGLHNEQVAKLAFKDEYGNAMQVNTTRMPDPAPLWSPRIGFNWDVFYNKTLQVRGGSGVFTGRPPFVWIGNQMGQNGKLLGETFVDNTTSIPFSPDITAHIPGNPTLPSSAQINIAADNYRFPQIWRSNIAIDKTLFAGIVGTLEFIYNKNVNAVRYININQADPVGNFSGTDSRVRYPGTAANNRLNPGIVSNYYMTNTNKGDAYSITVQLERPFINGLFARVAYNFGKTKDLMSAGSTAVGTYNGIFNVNGANYPELSYSNNDLRHRVIGSVSYRKEYADFGATQISLFYEAKNVGRNSYTYNGDMNGDGITGNDLIYVPNNTAKELTFLPVMNGSTVLYTSEQQIAAFDAYIEQDEYLKSRRGMYTERNGALMKMVYRADLSLLQEFFVHLGGKRNTIQLRADVFNVGNMINSNWGVAESVLNRQPLNAAGTNASGVPQYRMTTVGSSLLKTTYQNSAILSDVWTAQLGIRYIFN